MRSEDVQLGLLVQVHRGSREADLRGQIGIVSQRCWKHSSSPFEVQFENKQELLWALEFKDAEEFYEQYG